MQSAASTRTDSLAGLLAERFAGDARWDRLSRALYSTDASIYEIAPQGVACPRDIADVVTLVKACAEHKTPIIARGAGTGIAGGALGTGVIVDFSRHMHRILEIDPLGGRVRVQPGVVLDDLNAAVAPLGLTCPPDVATSSRATLGGMISNNSCGSHSVFYGRTVDYVESLTVVLSDGTVATWEQHAFDDLPANALGRVAQRAFGQTRPANRRDDVFQEAETDGAAIVRPCHTTAIEKSILAELTKVRAEYRDEVLARYPRVLRRNGGYALDRLCLSKELNPATLICGGEGTLGLVVEATLRLVPLPRHKALAVLHFDDLLDTIAATPHALRHRPAAVELVDHLILAAGAPRIPDEVRGEFLVGIPRAILICELYDESAESLRERMAALESELRREKLGQPAKIIFDLPTQAAVWNMRNKGFGLLMSRPGDKQPHEFIEDAAVDPSDLRNYIADLNDMLRAEGVTEVAHYAHASVGVLHVRPSISLKDPRDVAKIRRIAERSADLVLKYGGALTGEHGDGIVRSEFLERMYGPRIVEAFGRVKRAFDPAGIFNPGKIVNPWRMDERLRGARAVRALPQATQFDYGVYGGMRGLTEMCIGVGQCRQKLVGTMCPSYMATLDEKHTTRARANALRVALSDGGLINGLADPALDEVMELCISCKACKSECPTGVDMARLKAEWQAARVDQRGATPTDRFFAAAPRMARLGSRWPAVANAVTQSGWSRRLLEGWFGLDQRVAPPRFASHTFRQWWNRRAASALRKTHGRAIYFVDTWMNHYWPQVGIAAVQLLEAAGYAVVVPELVCCGRPLISRGLLDEARSLARRNVTQLAALLSDDQSVIVGSEPSCVLTLLDEYPHFVRTADARRIAARVKLVESALLDRVADLTAATSQPTATRQLLVHAHCHQKALVGTTDVMKLLNAISGLAAAEINSGCCGMAGSFGHEAAHYDVSRAIGEQRLFPAIRRRGDAEIAVCGFSCREQINHHLNLPAAHALQFAAAALNLSV